MFQFNQARRNPGQAMTASQALSDPLARTLTLVGAATGLAGKDSVGANSALEEANRSAQRIQDPAQQLQAAAMIAAATRQLQNRPMLQAALERGFQAADARTNGDLLSPADSRRGEDSLRASELGATDQLCVRSRWLPPPRRSGGHHCRHAGRLR